MCVDGGEGKVKIATRSHLSLELGSGLVRVESWGLEG